MEAIYKQSGYNDIDTQGKTGQVRTLCPQCSSSRKYKKKEKCLSVDTTEKIYFCHHCGFNGGHKNAKTYFKPDYKPLESGLPEKVVEWFKKRGISDTILALNKIGYGKSFGETMGIQFPFYRNGEVVNIKHRSGKKEFRQEKGAEKIFYRHDVIKEATELIITEGEIDALSVQMCGVDTVVSIPDGAPSAGAKSYTTKFDFLNSANLENVKKIVLCMDADEPGKTAEKELSRRLGHERCWLVTYPEDCKDSNEVLVKHGKEKLLEIIKNSKPYPICGVFSGSDFSDRIYEEYDNGVKGGVSTGWETLDNLYTVRTGEMTIVTGIPSHGKSNFLDSLAVNLAARNDWRFGMFSPENWPVQRHIRTLIEKINGKPFAFDRAGISRLSRGDIKEALEQVDDIFRFIAPEDEILSIETILKKAKQLILQFGIKGLIIDPWNEVEHNFGKLREDQYISQQLSAIRRFARQNSIHAWVVAHPLKLNKNSSGGYDPPTPYDISGGAHWRNKADNAICVHRWDFQTNETTVNIDKIRFKEIGEVGSCILNYDIVSGSYY